MALDQSALLEVLSTLKGADVPDPLGATTIYKALIEAELTAVTGAERPLRSDARTPSATATAPKR